MTETLMKPRTRVMWSAAERSQWLSLFDKSGQTAAEFCRDNDLSPATLSVWRQQSGDAEPTEARLIEVPMPKISAPSGGTPAVTLQLPSGARMDILVGTDPAWLAQLLRALTAAQA